jgi:hypothetical protein
MTPNRAALGHLSVERAGEGTGIVCCPALPEPHGQRTAMEGADEFADKNLWEYSIFYIKIL